MTNQASEDELDNLIEKRIKIASTDTKSGDEVVHIAWLADGIDIWHRSKGKKGHDPATARRYIISSVTRLIRNEKLKLLAEVDKSMPTAEQLATKYGYHMPEKQYGYKLALHDIREVLTKLEAEL